MAMGSFLVGIDAMDADDGTVMTIADIFKGPLDDDQPDLMVEAPAPDVAPLQGAPDALPPDVVPASGDDSEYYVHPLTGRRYKQDEYGENVRKTGRLCT